MKALKPPRPFSEESLKEKLCWENGRNSLGTNGQKEFPTKSSPRNFGPVMEKVGRKSFKEPNFWV